MSELRSKPPDAHKFTVEQLLGPVQMYPSIDDVPVNLRRYGESLPDGTFHVYSRAVNRDGEKSGLAKVFGTIFNRVKQGEPWSNATKPNQKRQRGPRKFHKG